VGFSRYLGVLLPGIGPTDWIVRPIPLSEGYALSLSLQQLVAIVMLVVLTAINSRGLRPGRWIQNVFTSTKTVALVLLIAVGLLAGWNAEAVRANFTDLWTPVAPAEIRSGFGWAPTLTAGAGLVGLLVALGVSQVGSLFSSDAWNNITFTAGEVKEPRRTIPRALALGTGLVIVLYLLANLAYLVTLPLDAIKTAPDDRVATATLNAIFGSTGAAIMAVAIVISTFGCNNGLVLAGARVYYAMARDGLFFRPVGTLNAAACPASRSGCSASGPACSSCRAPSRTRPTARPPTATSTTTCSTTSSSPCSSSTPSRSPASSSCGAARSRPAPWPARPAHRARPDLRSCPCSTSSSRWRSWSRCCSTRPTRPGRG
jgi:APA family basic amino acid/polyamine antiporter